MGKDLCLVACVLLLKLLSPVDPSREGRLLELNLVTAVFFEAELGDFDVRATGVERVDLFVLLDPVVGVFRVKIDLDLTVAVR